MGIRVTVEYAQSLASLEGDEFQLEVCAQLFTVILGFQTVPASPHGDAGLDAFSDGGKKGYCCYGPKHDEFKTASLREKAIIKKFNSDLRRLFELETKKKTLVVKESPEMATILPKNQKLESIYLIANWFDSHRVLGPIGTAFAEYKKASKCRYVSPDAQIVVLGPKELADRFAPDETTLYRVRQRQLMKSVQQKAQTITIDNPKDFEAKMQILREIRSDQVEAIEGLSQQFKDSWRMALAFERELDETVPLLHKALEDGRKEILAKVSELMLSSTHPWTQLGDAHNTAVKILEHAFGKAYQELLPQVSRGEIARLIGECPINWKKPQVNA